jgi:hypothetical protein
MLKCRRLFASLHQKKEGKCIYLTEKQNESLSILKESLKRTQKRSLESFLIAVAKYLKEDNAENFQLIETQISYLKEDRIKFPRYMDRTAEKYLTAFVNDYVCRINNLRAGKRDEWLQLLFSASFFRDYSVYQKIKDCSPFKGVLVPSLRGSGWIQIMGELFESVISNLLFEKGWSMDSGFYVLEIKENDLNKSDIYKVKEP